jgi:5-methylcytosine-specific restriction enzyme A
MPQSAMRPCSYPGCNTLVKHGRCAQHAAAAHVPEHQGLYNTQAWKRIRANQLADHPWCAECEQHGLYVPATDVDHIEPHKGDPKRFYAGPFQSLCHSCHSRKTAKEVGIC